MWPILVSAALAMPPEDFGAVLDEMQRAVAEVEDATFVLHQQEYVDGRLRDPEQMEVRYRAPNTVHVSWASGQRLVWIPGENGDRMRVDPGPLIPTISLAPDSALATRGQRHTIRRMGLAPVAALFASDMALIRADPERLAPTVTELPAQTLFGRAARCFDARMRHDLEPRLYAPRVEVCLDHQTHLPLRMRTWQHEDGELRLVETYGYEDLAVNVGLGADAFEL